MGSSIDALRCEKTWRQLGFDVYVYQDLGYNEIMVKIGYFLEKAKHFKLKVFGITFMGHGDSRGNLYTYASTTLKISNMLIKVQECQSLKNIPKLFFIQACRGKDPMKKVTLYDSEQTPLRADTLVHYCTYQDHVSLRPGIKTTF